MPEMTDEQRRELEDKIKKMSPEELREFQKQQCIFCQIISGKIPSKKVYEDKICYAVMDIYPAAIGHVLLFPKEHYAIMPQIPEKEIGHMFMVAKHLSQVMLKKLGVEGTNVFVANGLAAGQKAQHFMLHVIPRKEADGLMPLTDQLVDEAMREKLAVAIGNKMNELLGIKKERVVMKEKEEETEEEPEEVEEKEGGKEEEKEEKSPPGPAPDHPPQKEGEEEPKEGSEEEPEGEDKESKNEDDDEEGSDEGDEEKEEADDEEKEGEADLDDIANLFK